MRLASCSGRGAAAITEDMTEALKRLYSLLNQTQQQVADDLLPKLLSLTAPSGERITAR